MSDGQTNPSTMTRVRRERFDFIVAILTTVATSLAFGAAILTPAEGRTVLHGRLC